MEKQAHDPKVVLDAVEHALTARHPKTRYVMGANARPQKWIAKLPDRVVDRLVAKMTGG